MSNVYKPAGRYVSTNTPIAVQTDSYAIHVIQHPLEEVRLRLRRGRHLLFSHDELKIARGLGPHGLYAYVYLRTAKSYAFAGG